jgi:hypothetical protein
MVVVPGLEPGTSTLSVSRSNQLSYTTIPQYFYARFIQAEIFSKIFEKMARKK